VVGGIGSELGRVVYQADAICSSHLQRLQANQHCHIAWSSLLIKILFCFSTLSWSPISSCSYPFLITDQNTQAFKEVAIIRHPRVGEYAFGFITSTVVLQNYPTEEELCCVYVPTNHLYIGDILLVNSNDVIRPNLSVREGIEIVVSGGMSMPQILSTLDKPLASIGNES
jgi:hypothetical protein